MLERILKLIERDDVFEPLQIILIPALILLACLVYG
jgi:hypothetical protein